MPIRDHLEEIVLPYTSEELDEFTVLANHWPTCLQSEKVILCGSMVFLGIVKNELLLLVPDVALNISKLIWMWDAERVTEDELTLGNIRQAMAS